MAGVPERSLKCDIMTCDSEMETAHRNNALMHYMMDKKVFPPETSLEDTLKFYTRVYTTFTFNLFIKPKRYYWLLQKCPY